MYTNKNFIQKKEVMTVDLPEPPTDSVSCIAFNLENTHFAVASWDGSLRVYRLPYYASPGSNCTFEKAYPLGKPVISCCYFNGMLFAGLVDGSLVAVESGNTIKAHESIIKGIQNYNNQFFVTGSFDGTLKFWDFKSPSPIHSISLPAKVYSMELKDSFLVVALSDKTIITYDMKNVNQPTVFPTKMLYSLRCVACHKDSDSFATGSVEAKVEVFSRSCPSKKLAFRCHRVDNKLYSVNVIRFYPNDSDLIVTGGADGSLVWFDRMNRSKLFTKDFGIPITAGEFSNDGKYFIFAIGDDWSKGYMGEYIKPSLKMILSSSIPGLMNK